MNARVQRIHFIGIGGVGMSGIAELLHNQGYKVSGSDSSDSATLQRLAKLGIVTHVGHAAHQLGAAQVAVVSTAIRVDNPELVAAKHANVLVLQRAQMLAELMRLKQGVAVAGTHGKTTTTSLIASVLAKGGLDPTYVIGGRLHAAQTNASLGAGEYFVAEADESDASFLHLAPTFAVITNIDADHMETYAHSVDKLRSAFVEFANRLPFYGALYACIDDAGVSAIKTKLAKPLITYGLSAAAQVRATNVVAAGATMKFRAERDGFESISINLNLAGVHNVRNALAAVAIGQDLGVSANAITAALQSFAGVGRRFDRYGRLPIEGGSFELIDDYGHHPVELAATLAAARAAFPGKRLVLAFQPHRYSRTRDLFDAFAEVLATVDALYLTEIYAAGEAPIAGCSAASLATAVSARGLPNVTVIADLSALPHALLEAIQADDLVMTMGAGSIGQTPHQLVQLVNQSMSAEALHG